MKIAIVGAGLSGLVLADQLADKHTVQIFEKSRGRGGRMATKRLPWSSFDMGAQYFTARTNEFALQVQRWHQAGAVAPWSFTPYKKSEFGFEPSPDTTTRWVGTPAMNQPAHLLSRNQAIHFGCHIKRLQRSGNRWSLQDDAGNLYSGYDWVIVSAPLEQSTSLLKAHCDLPSSFQEPIHTQCWALAIETPTPLLQNEVQGIFGDNTISWAARDSAKPGRTEQTTSTWVIHFSPQWSAANAPSQPLQKLTESEKNDHQQYLARVASNWLAPCFKAPIEIKHQYAHFWRYANLTPSLKFPPCWIQPKQNIGIIGAWMSGGKVEGAFLSANAIQKQLI